VTEFKSRLCDIQGLAETRRVYGRSARRLWYEVTHERSHENDIAAGAAVCGADRS
jgi:hypothetical protein